VSRLGSREAATRLGQRLRLPLIGAPMFIASTPELVIAQCKAGVIGSMPALNIRPQEALGPAIASIAAALAEYDQAHPESPSAPFAINQIAHRTNERVAADLDTIVAQRVPIVIVSLAAPGPIAEAVHSYGGLVFCDVTTNRHARKAAEGGADGLIAVAAGAGGHTGGVSPFALVEDIRSWWDGPLALSGCIATGRGIAAARMMGADFVYVGSPFLACDEADTASGHKDMVVAGCSDDVAITESVTGVRATFLRGSLADAGIDPDAVRDPAKPRNFGATGSSQGAWRDIWSAGQGIGPVTSRGSAGDWLARLAADYETARHSRI